MGTLLWALRFKMSFFLRITNMLIFSPCQNYSLPKVIGRWRLAVLSIFWLSETLHIIPFFGQKKWSVAVFFIHLGEAFKRWAASTSWSRRGFWFAWYIVSVEYNFPNTRESHEARAFLPYFITWNNKCGCLDWQHRGVAVHGHE